MPNELEAAPMSRQALLICIAVPVAVLLAVLVAVLTSNGSSGAGDNSLYGEKTETNVVVDVVEQCGANPEDVAAPEDWDTTNGEDFDVPYFDEFGDEHFAKLTYKGINGAVLLGSGCF